MLRILTLRFPALLLVGGLSSAGGCGAVPVLPEKPGPPPDADGDGTPDEEDCAPTDAGVHPGVSDGCDGIDNDCDGYVDEEVPATLWYRDADLDGHGGPEARMGCAAAWDEVERSDDCDDTDPDRHPGADEQCDGEDDDCDGKVDEGSALVDSWWDGDLDGWGAGATLLACAGTPYMAATDGDCDDTDPTVNPGQHEVCDELRRDENCNDRADDRDPYVRDTTRWFPDLDGDGQGDAQDGGVDACVSHQDWWVDNNDDCDDSDPGVYAQNWFEDLDGDNHGAGSGRFVCPAPHGYVAVGDDCDDSDPTLHPGAVEACGEDAVDLNCDGQVGEGDLDGDGLAACEDCDDRVVDAGLLRYADADGDGWGDAAVGAVLCEEADGWASNAEDCDDTDAARSPGASEACDGATPGEGVDEDCDGQVDEEGADGCVEEASDFDGDGYGASPPRCLCAPSGTTGTLGRDCDDDDPARNPGVPERCDPTYDEDCNGESRCEETELVALRRGTTEQERVASGGFGAMEGPEGIEIAIGVPAETGAGRVELLGGELVEDATPVLTLYGGADAIRFGGAVRVADADGDGWPDLWVADRQWGPPAESSAGAVFLFSGPHRDGESADDAGVRWEGTRAASLGTTLSAPRDVDRDGLVDLAAGAPGYGDAGAVAVLGPGGGGVASGPAGVRGLAGYGRLGVVPPVLEDLDGDGLDDLFVMAAGSRAEREVLVVLPGPLDEWVDVESAPWSSAPSCGGTGARAGGVADDLSGDGLPDPWTANTRQLALYDNLADLGECAEPTLQAEAEAEGSELTVLTADLDADAAWDLVLVDPSPAEATSNLRVWMGPLAGHLPTTSNHEITLRGTLGLDSPAAVAGDVDGDGALDLLLASPRGGEVEGAGTAWLLATAPGSAW